MLEAQQKACYALPVSLRGRRQNARVKQSALDLASVARNQLAGAFTCWEQSWRYIETAE